MLSLILNLKAHLCISWKLTGRCQPFSSACAYTFQKSLTVVKRLSFFTIAIVHGSAPASPDQTHHSFSPTMNLNFTARRMPSRMGLSPISNCVAIVTRWFYSKSYIPCARLEGKMTSRFCDLHYRMRPCLTLGPRCSRRFKAGEPFQLKLVRSSCCWKSLVSFPISSPFVCRG